MTKKQLRQQGKSNRRSLSAEQRCEKSWLIVERVMSMDCYAEAQRVFCYAAMEDEVHTRGLLAAMLAAGKEVSIPLIDDEQKGIMRAVRLFDLTDMEKGKFDIDTVAGAESRYVPPEAMDLIIVPGTAFDAAGHRIGMGGGYYDRFLEKTSAITAGVAYECQIFPNLPWEIHDQALNYVITENKIYKGKDMT